MIFGEKTCPQGGFAGGGPRPSDVFGLPPRDLIAAAAVREAPSALLACRFAANALTRRKDAGSLARMTIADRAMEIAATGRYPSARAVEGRLLREGFSDARRHLTWSVRRRLNQICKAAGTSKAG